MSSDEIHSMGTAHDVVAKLAHASKSEFDVLRRAYAADTRKTVQDALHRAERRIELEEVEQKRVDALYAYQSSVCDGRLCVGMDEVGRGPLAGPLVVGAVVLPDEPHVLGINDSKKLTAHAREQLVPRIEDVAIRWATFSVSPDDIDRIGMAQALRHAFSGALAKIEESGVHPDVVLIDGNPLHIDSREVNVVHGDARCASISCASIVAKVTRDHVMEQYARVYPAYHFDQNKGYGSQQHIRAIETHGLTPIHRKTFCKNFHQETLF